MINLEVIFETDCGMDATVELADMYYNGGPDDNFQIDINLPARLSTVTEAHHRNLVQ